jgi:hypothetical protein
MTEYQFTNFAHGETVWFVWTNIGDSTNIAYLAIYEQMVNSFLNQVLPYQCQRQILVRVGFLPF